jgi:hypothetical protein
VAWLLLLVLSVIVFAVLFDVVARARGRYLRASQWEAARRRRKSRGRSFRADPEDRQQR